MKLRNKKTGEVFDALIREKGGGGTYSIIVCNIKAYNQSKSTLGATHSILDEYDSLAELNEDWEDYTPAEPLIKDKEVRNIVRLWAKYHNADILQYRELSGCVGHYLKAGLRSIGIDIDSLKPGMFYTIEELCGEEEQCES